MGVGRDPDGVRDVVVAALLAASGGPSLVTVGEAATALRLAPGYLYAHSERLGGMRLGSGPTVFDYLERGTSCGGR